MANTSAGKSSLQLERLSDVRPVPLEGNYGHVKDQFLVLHLNHILDGIASPNLHFYIC